MAERWDNNKTRETVNTNNNLITATTLFPQTFTQVLRTDPITDYYYFNQIDCSSELNCIVVGEGQDGAAGADATIAYTTFDGGVTWALTKSGSDDVGLTAVKFSSATEAWIGGIGYDGRKAAGHFSKTTDGGKTWTLEQVLDGCLVMDIDFGVNMGVAACTSATGGLSSVAFLK